ncbi:MAG: rhomboid family intramembrane serine protease [Gemmatimonadaceae bacterium]
MTPWVLRLIVINAVMFLLSSPAVLPMLRPLLFLVPGLAIQRPWTLITYTLLHADLLHLLFNMLGLYFFGPRLEARMGSTNFLWLYLFSGLGGALLSVVTPMFGLGSAYVPIVGASGSIFGVFLGFARYWPRERVYIWGVLPVEAWLLVIIMTVLSLYGAATGGGNIAHFAHLGGYLGGYLFLKWMELRSPARQFRKKSTGERRGLIATDSADLRRWRTIRREDLHELNRNEVDRLFSKIEATGVGSLTPDERACLDRFSQR